ncbi:MAG: (2Fe-2S)-binding protein [SAR202 cluster bacterium]|nr:(2Fe-2S)-binding protein [SAR202 cluster bacterium]|tara:strand:- start:3627 stop:4103 length:477 start_codon:yes stop_codon:yes gene_type:complete
MKKIVLKVNGVRRKTQVEDRELLVDVLREKLRLTGTHIGCDTSQCGACTVLVDDHAVKSCAMFALQAEGSKITTIEGIATGGELHPIQKAFHEQHGLQCGFCTPGMIMTLHDYLSRNSNPTEEQIRTALAGNICRCTGYQNIVESALAVTKYDRINKQ